ncbi:hypothetical protein G6L37_00245 [Agrobacterium rubi]|nr:hypothetical protein [Agrobacterium rubi]NTF23680.1 hypothetical protein [Agrobacterium rubi]
MNGSDYAKAAGDLIGTGIAMLIGLAVTLVAAVIVIVFLVVKIFFFSEDAVTPNAVPAVAVTSPIVEFQYPKVSGLCFRTPMGDVGKVIGQEKDMLEMTFRGGVKSTYQFNQVSHADCGVLPAG